MLTLQIKILAKKVYAAAYYGHVNAIHVLKELGADVNTPQ